MKTLTALPSLRDVSAFGTQVGYLKPADLAISENTLSTFALRANYEHGVPSARLVFDTILREGVSLESVLAGIDVRGRLIGITDESWERTWCRFFKGSFVIPSPRVIAIDGTKFGFGFNTGDVPAAISFRTAEERLRPPKRVAIATSSALRTHAGASLGLLGRGTYAEYYRDALLSLAVDGCTILDPTLVVDAHLKTTRAARQLRNTVIDRLKLEGYATLWEEEFLDLPEIFCLDSRRFYVPKNKTPLAFLFTGPLVKNRRESLKSKLLAP